MIMRTRYLGRCNLAKPAIILLHFAILNAFFTWRITAVQSLLVSIASSATFVSVLIALTLHLVFRNPCCLQESLLKMTRLKSLSTLFNSHLGQ